MRSSVAMNAWRRVCSTTPLRAASLLDRLELVAEDVLRVQQQTTDQRGLAVVHGAGGGESEELDAQKYPSRLRSSIAASVARSSARVSPRSVSVDAAISWTTSSSVVAAERTAPVHVMSPTVRYRTVSSNGSSSSRRSTKSLAA